jgi:hypothetical protein
LGLAQARGQTQAEHHQDERPNDNERPSECVHGKTGMIHGLIHLWGEFQEIHDLKGALNLFPLEPTKRAVPKKRNQGRILLYIN